MLKTIFRALRERGGATSIEYALIASLISIFIVGAVMAVGDSQNGMFAHILDNVVPALSGGSGGE